MKRLKMQRAGLRTRALATFLLLPACTSPNTNHYVIASTGTVIGVEVAQNPANQTPQAKLGYNRAELALVPTSRPPCVAKSDDSSVTCGEIKGKVKDVPDVLMELRYGGIFDLGASSGIYQRLAVGETAVQEPGATFLFAKGPDGKLDAQAANAIAAQAKAVVELRKSNREAILAFVDADGLVKECRLQQLIEGTSLAESQVLKSFAGKPIAEFEDLLISRYPENVDELARNIADEPGCE